MESLRHPFGERAITSAPNGPLELVRAALMKGKPGGEDLLTGHPQSAVVVLGDLNDEVEAATTQIVNGPPGSEIGTHPLPLCF